MKTLVVGGGNMAQAILGGSIAKGVPAANFCVVEPLAETRTLISRLGVPVFPSLSPGLVDCDAVVLAVKPQMMREAVLPLAGALKSQVVISIAAGVSTASLALWLGRPAAPYENVVRAMPNTPALIRAGITGLFAAPGVNDDGRLTAETLLAAVGKTVWFEKEAMLDAVTAVSGSGPAYVFYFIEALEQAAVDLGFAAEDARLFAVQTFLGGAQLAASATDSPAVLRARVTSKNGTTERAIGAFDRHALKAGFIDGVTAACDRSRELGRELAATAAVSMDGAGGTD